MLGLALPIAVLVQLIEALLGQLEVSIVEVEAVALLYDFTCLGKLHIAGCKTAEHWVGEWLSESMTAISYAIWEVIGYIKSSTQAELSLRIVSVLVECVKSRVNFHTKLHIEIEFVQLNVTLQLLLNELVLILKDRCAHECKIVVKQGARSLRMSDCRRVKNGTPVRVCLQPWRLRDGVVDGEVPGDVVTDEA